MEATLGVLFALKPGQSAYMPAADLLISVRAMSTAADTATLAVSRGGKDLGEVSLSETEETVEVGGLTVRLLAVNTNGAWLRVEASANVVSANTRFAFDLLRELRMQDGEENLFLSPLSISVALAMTYNGADGETKAAMEEALRLSGLGLDAINAGNAALLSTLAGRGPELELNIANSLWARDGISFDQEFLGRVEEHFNAEVTSLPFDAAAVERINAWVSEATNGKIDQILNEISPQDLLYLINAVYFKATWMFIFDEEQTKTATFHNGDGTEAEVPMMQQSYAKYDYLEGDGFAALRLRYQGDASMYVFLPDEDSDLPAFMEGLNAESWQRWMADFASGGGGTIKLPRFEMEYETTLNDVLGAMGMEIAFGGGADFSKMGLDGAFISFVKHKAVLEVHEHGTEAAAATIVVIATSGPRFTFEFIADRPFFFAITDDHTGSVLFTGAVHELGQ